MSLICQVAQARIDSGYTQQRRRTRPCPGQASTQEKKECMKANNPHRLELKHIESKGIGYNQGYSSLDAFFTGKEGDYIPFVDLRGHVFNDGKWATNVGVGTRYIFDPCLWMVGVNGYFDYRSTHSTTHFTQIGAGIEAFYDRFDFRLNGYLPVGHKRKRTKTHLESISFKRFSGNYILINEHYNNTYHGAMKGFNAELGGHLFGNRTQYDVYLAAGPYYYTLTEGKETWGGKARLKIGLTRCLFLEVSDSYDWIFRNRLQGSINVTIPFAGRRWMRSKATCRNVMNWQAVMPPERQEIIVVSKFKKKQTIDPVAIDPSTGKPFYVVFVNNTHTGLGNGTFENPFQNLSNNDNMTSAQSGSFPNNTLYVFAGDGTAAHMQGGNMQLQANQRFLGSGNAHQYLTTKGLLTIPAQTTNRPSIKGVTGIGGFSAVLLADNNEVSGFNISFNSISPVDSGKACILGNGPIVSANINNNILTNETSAIFFTGLTAMGAASGTLLINNNVSSLHAPAYRLAVVNATVTFENNSTTNDTLVGGLRVDCFGNVTASIQNNVFLSETGTGYTITNNNGAILPSTFVITDNTVNNATTGFVVTNNSALGAVIIHDRNTILNTQQPSTISSTSGICCVRFNQNTGMPTSASPPFSITQLGGTLTLEPPLKNFPQPTTSSVTLVPACTCAPCSN